MFQMSSPELDSALQSDYDNDDLEDNVEMAGDGTNGSLGKITEEDIARIERKLSRLLVFVSICIYFSVSFNSGIRVLPDPVNKLHRKKLA